MTGYLLDTHTALWYLMDAYGLSKEASDTLDRAEEEGAPIYLATISLVEVTYLVEKGKLPVEALNRLRQAATSESGGCHAVPLSVEVADHLGRFRRADVPDMPDRIIAATASAMDVPLITRDHRLLRLDIKTVW